MSDQSAIEWCDHTFNPWWGCTRVSAACDHCYAEALASRYGNDVWGHDRPRKHASESYWRKPHIWNSKAVTMEHRPRVFCASMADIFEERSDLDDARTRLFKTIDDTPRLDWLLLTKRPQAIKRLSDYHAYPRDNVWLGVTIENMSELSKRLHHLLELRAAIRFLSCEPLLESLACDPLESALANGLLHWVIAGGETGNGARPTQIEWFYELRDLCAHYAVPFFFKQYGDWCPTWLSSVHSGSRMVNAREYRDINGVQYGRYWKKQTGRTLDATIHDDFPAPTTSDFRKDVSPVKYLKVKNL